jgi:glycine/D-amino acid oxidase-like deaminating enzyme/nitrite reductase/ring-hydroxylating ferredoxin subunit
MNHGSQHLESVPWWLVETVIPETWPLAESLEVDVCVVGAGVAGLSVAYELTLRGKVVAVIDRVDVASGETGRSTAQLGTALDTRYFDLERLHGAEGARIAAESHGAAISRIESIVTTEGIECGFQRLDGYLFAAPGQPSEVLDRELAAATRAGLQDLEMLAAAPLESFATGRCLRFPNQGQLDPARYCAGLAKAILARGGRIYTGTQATSVTGGAPARVETAEGHVVTAAAVVVATNTPMNNLVALHTKQTAWRTYVIAAPVPKESVALGLFWDTDDPYHYIRLDQRRRDHDILLVGGEDHKTGQDHREADRWVELERWMRARFPMADRIASCWSGQVMQSIDGLGFIGKNPMDSDNVLVVTGDTGTGMTHGAIAGLLLADTLTGEKNRWAKIYEPSRVTLRAAPELIKQNLGAVQQYANWLEAGDVAEEDEIPPGHGAVVRQGVRLLAVYRDEHGHSHRCSAVCPHLGGIVQWNGAERSWDCPCHGSRFDALGRLMHGPANVDLSPAHDQEAQPAEAEPEVPLLPLTGLIPG